MFNCRFNSAVRTLSRPVLKNFSLPRPRATESRRFFQRHSPQRKRVEVLAIFIASAVGVVSVMELAVDRFAPPELSSIWRRTPFQTAKSHLQKLRGSSSDTQNLPAENNSNPWAGINRGDYKEESLLIRLHVREMYRRARASGREEDLRNACFNVIPYLGSGGVGPDYYFEELGPLAPLPRDHPDGGRSASLFDVAKDSRVYCTKRTDGTISTIFVAINADFEPVYDDNSVFIQALATFIHQCEAWEREKPMKFDQHPHVRVLFSIREHFIFTQFAPLLKKFSPDMTRFSWNDKLAIEVEREGKKIDG